MVLAAGCALASAPSQSSSAAPPSQPASAADVPPGPWDPPAALADLARTPGVVFSFREELSHDHVTLPMWRTAFDPRTYAGHPLGYYQVTAFASVAITQGAQVLGNYTAQAQVEQPYTIYSGPTFMQLERRARAEVRRALAADLVSDAARLRAAVAHARQPPVQGFTE
ncbi:MAG TPA: hypothetical protein VKV28_09035 [Candidatus Binataceae bacterium]|nr:hypothetical protein [Candidatus Binataceae bacterium]